MQGIISFRFYRVSVGVYIDWNVDDFLIIGLKAHECEKCFAIKFEVIGIGFIIQFYKKILNEEEYEKRNKATSKVAEKKGIE